jgi:hypothetical protein
VKVLPLSEKERLLLYLDGNIGHVFAEKMTALGHDATSVLFRNANGESDGAT